MAVSPFHFHRLFKQVVGATPREYARAERVARFGQALDARPAESAEAAYGAGFGSELARLSGRERGAGHDPRRAARAAAKAS